MDAGCLQHCLTEEESQKFERDGFFMVHDAVPPQLVGELVNAVDRLDREYRASDGISSHELIHILDFIGRDASFLTLLDWPQTFPKVWGILGWNIQLYHSDPGMIISPPDPSNEPRRKRRLEWHQDSGRLNLELEGDPRPRVSLKIGFFLTDTSEPGGGNFCIVPGSHRLAMSSECPVDKTGDQIRRMHWPSACRRGQRCFLIAGYGIREVRIIPI